MCSHSVRNGFPVEFLCQPVLSSSLAECLPSTFINNYICFLWDFSAFITKQIKSGISCCRYMLSFPLDLVLFAKKYTGFCQVERGLGLFKQIGRYHSF